MAFSRKWEHVDRQGAVRRLKTPQGWVVESCYDTEGGVGLCFVPDPDHEWELERFEK